MTEHFEHDGIRFAFERAGAGAPLVLLHGLGGDRGGALDMADTRAGWIRLALDFRGHGETEPVGPDVGFTFSSFARDLAAFLDAAGVEAAVIAGVSMGAAVALRFALDQPARVRSLVLVRPAWLHTPLTENLRPYAEIARLLRTMPPDAAVATFMASAEYAAIGRVSRHAADSLVSQFTRPAALTRVSRLEWMPRSAPYADPSELKGIATPTLVVGCERDPLHPIEFASEWAAHIPGAALQAVPSSADDIAEHRAAVRRAVGSFLQKP